MVDMIIKAFVKYLESHPEVLQDLIAKLVALILAELKKKVED